MLKLKPVEKITESMTERLMNVKVPILTNKILIYSGLVDINQIYFFDFCFRFIQYIAYKYIWNILLILVG